MAKIDACILTLRSLGYKARMKKISDWGPASRRDILGDTFVVRCQGFTVNFNELLGITVSSIASGDAIGIIDYYHSEPKKVFHITYLFENQSFFFSLEDDAFVDCVVRHVGEASDVVSALPERLQPS
jgi:hypothetical protein